MSRKKTTTDLASFDVLGKTYVGVRYPQDKTIRPPLCVVSVIPEDGMTYNLDPRIDIYDFSGVRNVKRREGIRSKDLLYEFDWGCLNGRSQQLALAILADLISNDVAKELHMDFEEKIIRKLPELEWRLSGPKEIMSMYETEIVLLGFGMISIKE